jgi:geranyl-CoA carboxylase alpha subunit
MQAAGVPCVPGYDGESQDEATLAAEAARLGYPVMIKAARGGGGRGMRLVRTRELFLLALRSARSEAQAAFGSAEVILERAIEEPRHVEVQIVADRHGNIVQLGERDCSIQRRHQKLIEEAPSPAVTPEIRARMGATAVAAARAIKYESAGTLEFLLDREGRFYFMEMNTRLQVEHPVTEAITGLDLVELQLRVAAGEPLPLGQDDVRFRGHAIECRLCAESVELEFMPQTGVMSRWEMPTSVRVEHALESGARVSPYYDSMLAKLVAFGATREDARRRLVSALEDTVALGVATNQTFLGACLDHPDFVTGRATTSFIGRHGDDLTPADPERDARAHRLAAVLLTSSPVAQQTAHDGSVISHPLPILFRFETDSSPCAATVVRHGAERYEVTIADRTTTLTIEERGSDEVTFSLDGLRERAAFKRDVRELHLRLRGRVYHVVDTTHAAAVRKADGSGDGKVRAAMAGRVVSLLVSPGARVNERQSVLTLEAMKMEHTLVAPIAGCVASVNVALGAQVSANQVLVEIAAEHAAPSGLKERA